MKRLLQSILIILVTFSASLFASELTAPKAEGLIGERFDGYIGIVKDAPLEIRELVDSVNQKRKAHYEEIAKKRQQPLKKIELIAGETAMKKTKPGNYIFLADKGWIKK